MQIQQSLVIDHHISQGLKWENCPSHYFLKNTGPVTKWTKSFTDGCVQAHVAPLRCPGCYYALQCLRQSMQTLDNGTWLDSEESNIEMMFRSAWDNTFALEEAN